MGMTFDQEPAHVECFNCGAYYKLISKKCPRCHQLNRDWKPKRWSYQRQRPNENRELKEHQKE